MEQMMGGSLIGSQSSLRSGNYILLSGTQQEFYVLNKDVLGVLYHVYWELTRPSANMVP